MPKIELTETLRNTIKQLRKDRKIRGDVLSKEIGKGTSYISQIESGKIKEIDFDALNNILYKITNLPENEYASFINDIIENSYTRMTSEEIKKEKWLHLFEYQLRKFPIPDSLIEYIKEHLQILNISSEEFVKIINQNRGLNTDIKHTNKLKIELIDYNDGKYGISHSIKFDLPLSLIDDIISKKITVISYIYMEGILYNLFLSEGVPNDQIFDKCHELLYKNGFLTIEERNQAISENITKKRTNNEPLQFEDILPTEYDTKFSSLYSKINKSIRVLRDANIKFTVDKLNIINNNLSSSNLSFLSFVISFMALDLTHFKDQSFDTKKEFLSEVKKLIKKYSSPTTTTFDTYDD